MNNPNYRISITNVRPCSEVRARNRRIVTLVIIWSLFAASMVMFGVVIAHSLVLGE